MVFPEENCDDGSNDNIGCVTGCSSGFNSDFFCYGGSPTSPSLCDKCGNFRIEADLNETCEDGTRFDN